MLICSVPEWCERANRVENYTSSERMANRFLAACSGDSKTPSQTGSLQGSLRLRQTDLRMNAVSSAGFRN